MRQTFRQSASDLAEQAFGPEGEHQDQHEERDHVLEGRVHEGHRQAFDHAQQQAAEHRALDVADAAEHGRGERLEPRREAHEEVDLGVVQADQHAGGAAERGAEKERDRDHPVDVDPHDRRHLAVLGDRADRAPERGALHQEVQAPHHHERDRRHHQEQHRDADPEHLEPPAAREQEVGHVDLHPGALAQHHRVLQEDRGADRADQRAEPGRAAGIERAIGEALERGAEQAAGEHRRQQHDRQHPGRVQAADLGREQPAQHAPADVGADHEHLAVREVDHEQHAVDHGVADRDQTVDGAEREAEDQLLGQDRQDVHGLRSRPDRRGGCGRRRAAPPRCRRRPCGRSAGRSRGSRCRARPPRSARPPGS